MRKITVTIPASTTNIGCGFDCLGLALSLYNTVEVEKIKGDEVIVEIEGEGRKLIPTNEENIIFPALKMVFDRVGEKLKGLRIKEVNRIPLEKGLGSSAATRLGGIVAASCLLKANLDTREILKMAVSLEGHPDNVAASLLGGFVAVTFCETDPVWVKLPVPETLRVVIVIPDKKILTRRARRVLPEKISFSDAVFNLSRLAILVPSLSQGIWENLALATQDKLHQPYRTSLLPEMEDVFEAALDAGAKGVFLSGAGSGVAAFSFEDKAEKIGRAMQKIFLSRGTKANYLILCVDKKGCRVDEKKH